MEENESKVQKVKQYILRNKVLVSITACLVIIILVMSGTVSSAVNQRELMSDQLQEQTEQYEDLQSNFDTLSAQYDDLTDAYDTLQAELTNYQDQQATIDDLNIQLTDLQEKYDTLSAENEELKAQVAQSENRSGGGGGTGSGGGILYIPDLSSESSNDSGNDMVWIPAHGEKYHSIPDCGTMNPDTASQVTRSSAETMGYDACSKCW